MVSKPKTPIEKKVTVYDIPLAVGSQIQAFSERKMNAE